LEPDRLIVKSVLKKIIHKINVKVSKDPYGLISLVQQSDLFDFEFYSNQFTQPLEEVALSRTIRSYIFDTSNWKYSPSSGFDAEWYLTEYPDVAKAEINPLVHYLQFGRLEGRQPMKNRALVWDFHLWRGNSEIMISRLLSLKSDADACLLEKSFACWSLARWYAYSKMWKAALECIEIFKKIDVNAPDHTGPWLVGIQAAIECNAENEAITFLNCLKNKHSKSNDIFLANSNILFAFSDEDNSRLNLINSMYERSGLLTIRHIENHSGIRLKGLRASKQKCTFDSVGLPYVSVIVPMYNAEDTLFTTLVCLSQQTFRNLEILIVDDCSTDSSVQVATDFIASLPVSAQQNWKLILQSYNQGAYTARNKGAKAATGEFITVHDADDWSHPQKIEKQVLALLADVTKAASISSLARANEELFFTSWRTESSWIYRNTSSLMIRSKVLKEIGFWDRIKAGADTEYYYRILKAYGKDAIVEVLKEVPLSFLLSSPGSLTQQSDTHLITQFGGLRKDYMDAAFRWHSSTSCIEDLYLPEIPNERPFAIPKFLGQSPVAIGKINTIDVIQQSDYFDSVWYLNNYIELQQTTIDAAEHYWSIGQHQGYDPGPLFSTSGYGTMLEKHIEKIESPLFYFLTHKQEDKFSPLPVFDGEKVINESAKSIMLVGHSAGTSLFGAERSFIDLLMALSKLNFNLIVALPCAVNKQYISTIKQYCVAVAIIPSGWWQKAKPNCGITIELYRNLLRKFAIDAVHVNTVLTDSIAFAANLEKIPVVTHAREILSEDPALCSAIGADPIDVYEHVCKSSAAVIANSKAMYDDINVCSKGKYVHKLNIIPNTIDMDELLELSPPIIEDKLKVGMLSSNNFKKGITHLIRLAESLENKKNNSIQFYLFGDKSKYVDDIIRRKAKGELKNIIYAGYIDNSKNAIKAVDVVINLSLFAESFGRTILEAMAGARVTVCYHHGALIELAEKDHSGYLVEYSDLDEFEMALCKLDVDRELALEMGLNGRSIAKEKYSNDVFSTLLEDLYLRLLS
tara:strand:- start:108 stop:3197 length:3090 start_codon:yes stop_codon:yes gene_type:complete